MGQRSLDEEYGQIPYGPRLPCGLGFDGKSIKDARIEFLHDVYLPSQCCSIQDRTRSAIRFPSTAALTFNVR